MFQIDFTLVLTILLFGITFFMLKRILFTPVNDLLARRAAYLESVNREKEESVSRADLLTAEYNQKIRDCRNQGAQKVEQAMLQAQSEKQNRLAAREKEMTKILKDKEIAIRRELERGREQLEPEVDAFAGKIAAKILGRPIK